jgi:esterase/lipase
MNPIFIESGIGSLSKEEKKKLAYKLLEESGERESLKTEADAGNVSQAGDKARYYVKAALSKLEHMQELIQGQLKKEIDGLIVQAKSVVAAGQKLKDDPTNKESAETVFDNLSSLTADIRWLTNSLRQIEEDKKSIDRELKNTDDAKSDIKDFLDGK